MALREKVLGHLNVESGEGGAVPPGARLDLNFPRPAPIKPC